jgi:hypothetical protein
MTQDAGAVPESGEELDRAARLGQVGMVFHHQHRRKTLQRRPRSREDAGLVPLHVDLDQVQAVDHGGEKIQRSSEDPEAGGPVAGREHPLVARARNVGGSDDGELVGERHGHEDDVGSLVVADRSREDGTVGR